MVEFGDDDDATSTGTVDPSTTTGLLTTAAPDSNPEPVPDPTVESSSGDGEDSSTSDWDPECDFICEYDVPFGDECDYFEQDCARGEKCVAWANDGGNAWNAMRCVPVVPDPAGLGETCTVEGSGASGLDDCDFGLVCRWVDAETGQGTCLAMCSGDENNPTCPTCTTCVGYSRTSSYLCIPACDPVLQDCADGQGCYPADDGFVCAPDASGDLEIGDACEYINGCPAGSTCVAAPFPECDGIRCCAELCDADDPTSCDDHPGLTCVEPREAYPACGREATSVGHCGVP